MCSKDSHDDEQEELAALLKMNRGQRKTRWWSLWPLIKSHSKMKNYDCSSGRGVMWLKKCWIFFVCLPAALMAWCISSHHILRTPKTLCSLVAMTQVLVLEGRRRRGVNLGGVWGSSSNLRNLKKWSLKTPQLIIHNYNSGILKNYLLSSALSML